MVEEQISNSIKLNQLTKAKHNSHAVFAIAFDSSYKEAKNL